MSTFLTTWGPVGLISIGAVLSLIGGIWAGFNQSAKTEEIAELNWKIAATVTGGDSFCYLDIANLGRGSRDLVVVHKGEAPMYEVSARAVDLQAWRASSNAGTPSALSHWKGSAHFDIGNLIPGHLKVLRRWTYPETDRDFNVFFAARNGAFTQLLRLRKVGEEWKIALRVTRGDEVLHERVDEGYPRTESGEVNWESEEPLEEPRTDSAVPR